MTIEETIKTLETAKAEVEWNYPLDYAIAIDKAIGIIEKEIPTECIPIYTLCGDKQLICPKCERSINKKYYEKNGLKRCTNCGQAIDWRKENGE